MIPMPSLEFIADSLDGDGNLEDISKYDFNGDSIITAEDCPYSYGSPAAKLWWKNILEPYTQNAVTEDYVEKYGDHIIGVYKGKPLIPGESGAGQGDFDYLVDKIRITQGLDYQSATKIAGKIQLMRFGV